MTSCPYFYAVFFVMLLESAPEYKDLDEAHRKKPDPMILLEKILQGDILLDELDLNSRSLFALSLSGHRTVGDVLRSVPVTVSWCSQ